MTAPARTQTQTIQRILFAVDFSLACGHAARHVRMLTRLYGAHLWVVHAVTPALPPDAALLHSDGALQNAAHHMANFCLSEPLRDLGAESVVRDGDLQHVLSEIVHDYNIDLVAIATHGRGWLSKAVVGSSAELISRSAACPVLTVGPHASAESSQAILRILVPIDGRLRSERTIAFALALANENNAQVIFLRVLHRDSLPLDYPDEEAIDDERYMEAMAGLRMITPDPDAFRREPEVFIESGVPADTIVEVANKTGADLILMPIHRAASNGKNHSPWSTAYRVMARATCPVLTFAE